MKLLIMAFSILVSASALAGMNLDTAIEILSMNEVEKELKGKDIRSIQLNSETSGTSWTYTLRIKASAAGLGIDGPSSRPCIVKVEVTTRGGVAGTVVSAPRITSACAQNSPAPTPNNPQGFVCQKGWINCMPILAPGRAKYCGEEYRQWAIENCGGAPKIAY